MKKELTFFFAIVIVVASFGGCQATPEKPVVVQKDMEQMIETGMSSDERLTQESVQTQESALIEEKPKIDYAELCAHYGVPVRLKVNVNEQSVKIHADVVIELPQTIKLPMANVEATKFSQEQINALFNELCGDTQMYIMPSIWDKACYEQQIIEWQAQLAVDGIEKDYINFVNGIIDDLKKQYEAAPDSIDLVASDGTLQTMEVAYDVTDAASGIQTYLQAASDPYALQDSYSVDAQSIAMQFLVYNDIDYSNTDVYSYVDEQGNTQNFVPSSGSRVEFQRDTSLCRYGRGGQELEDVTALSFEGGSVEDCLMETTPRQARKIVEQLLADIGLDDMFIDKVMLYSSKEEMPPPEVIERWKEQGMPTQCFKDESEETYAYVFRLLRELSGVKVESDHDSSVTNMNGVSYGKEWMYEMLTIAVDDEGIVNFFWTGPLNVTEVLTEDTTIRPWCDIEDVFKKMMVIQNIPYTEHCSDLCIDVTHVSLSLQRIMERDSFTTGLLVPVWNFYGTRTFINEWENTIVMDEKFFPLLSVNAIDGSIIDPFKGY